MLLVLLLGAFNLELDIIEGKRAEIRTQAERIAIAKRARIQSLMRSQSRIRRLAMLIIAVTKCERSPASPVQTEANMTRAATRNSKVQIVYRRCVGMGALYDDDCNCLQRRNTMTA